VESGIVTAGSAIDFPRKGKARSAGVARGGEECDTTEAGFRGGLSESRKFSRYDGQRIGHSSREFVFVDKLISEAGYAHGVIGSLAADDEQVGVVGYGVLVISAIAAASADSTALGEEGDEADSVARGVRSVERRDVIEQRGFAVDGFGEFVFGVAAEDDMVFLVHGEDGGGTDFEMGDGRIGACAFRGVKSAKDLRA
jgi:hypothetical protein